MGKITFRVIEIYIFEENKINENSSIFIDDSKDNLNKFDVN